MATQIAAQQAVPKSQRMAAFLIAAWNTGGASSGGWLSPMPPQLLCPVSKSAMFNVQGCSTTARVMRSA